MWQIFMPFCELLLSSWGVVQLKKNNNIQSGSPEELESMAHIRGPYINTVLKP